MTTEDKTQEEQLGKELETVMERACNNLSKGAYADLDNKVVNWPLLFSEVLTYIKADRKAQSKRLLDAIEERGPKDEPLTPEEADNDISRNPTIQFCRGINNSNGQWRSILKELREEL
jgi:hypothetical protein